MPLSKPFKRTVRQLVDGSYANSGNGNYVEHPNYASFPSNHLRAFGIIVRDFEKLLEYIEPSDINLDTYSFRIHELLLRVCIEVESNFYAILNENGFHKRGNWNLNDYKKIEITHHLSSYEVRIPLWKGNSWLRKPFFEWKDNQKLNWFNDYNKIKHERHLNFEKSSFKNLTDAICGLAVVIASQFMAYNANAKDVLLSLGGPNDGMDALVGDFFRIKYPRDWNEEEKYGFNWEELKTDENPIACLNYNT